MNNFKSWLYSRNNLAGMLLATMGAALYLAGIIDQWWLPICLGGYLLGYMAVPKVATLPHFTAVQRGVQELEDALTTLKSLPVDKLPNQAQTLFHSILSNAQELKEFLSKSPQVVYGIDMQALNLYKIFNDYLPKLINQYVVLPSQYAEKVPAHQGKTAKDMLLEQLTLLDDEVRKIAYALYENDVKSLRVHGALLNERFASKEMFMVE